MDTKKKNRSEDPKKRSRSGTQGKAAPSRRSAPARKRQSPVQDPRKRRPEQVARRQESNTRRPREAEAEMRQRVENVASDAPEMVFRIDAQEEKQKLPPLPKDPVEAKREQQRRRSAQRTKERKKQASRRSRAPEVVYTQPKPFNLNRLLLQLTAVMAVVIAISLGLSVFFKVDKVVVYGNKAYTAWAIQDASGIEGGEKLLTFGRIRASGKIKAELPYVDTVRIGITLPDTVNIYITEYDVVYAIKDQDQAWWLMTSDGRVVEQTNAGTAGSYTKVLGVELDHPIVGERAIAYQQITFEETTDATEALLETEPPVIVTPGERLTAALNILETLELNDMVGLIASVDVTTMTDIELWYGNQYQVRLGDATDLDYKITCMSQAVSQLSDYQTGILDVSFMTWQDQVGYTPFG